MEAFREKLLSATVHSNRYFTITEFQRLEIHNADQQVTLDANVEHKAGNEHHQRNGTDHRTVSFQFDFSVIHS